MPVAANIGSIKVFAQTTAGTTVLKPVVYSDVAGVPTALLATGSTVTGVVYGVTKLPLTSPLAVTKGQVIWIGVTIAAAAFPAATAIAIPNAFFTATSGTPPNPAVTPTIQVGNNITCWASTDT